MDNIEENIPKPKKWSLGVLNDKETDEVPGSVILLSKDSPRNEPLGLHHAPATTSSSSIPSSYPPSYKGAIRREKKRTKDGKFILEPQPDDSPNDPLNWSPRRRDAALLSIGFYCMVGGGMTPILAAGFNDVAKTYDVAFSKVALTTGLYMMGMGVGGVFASPTAILFGKRPVYLFTSIVFLLTSVWCALSPNYPSLLIARIVQGISVSPVEVLPSASVAEIFFLHERAYRLGIYTLLLLGGKNLVPLVSAAVIQAKGWRWVFWVVAIVVGFCCFLLFFFVPETFWDRTPRGKKAMKHEGIARESPFRSLFKRGNGMSKQQVNPSPAGEEKPRQNLRIKFAEDAQPTRQGEQPPSDGGLSSVLFGDITHRVSQGSEEIAKDNASADLEQHSEPKDLENRLHTQSSDTGALSDSERRLPTDSMPQNQAAPDRDLEAGVPDEDQRQDTSDHRAHTVPLEQYASYTNTLRNAPVRSYRETLHPFSGRLSYDNWFRVAFRPFILFAYPSVLWSTVVYSLSIGWLIVLSESVADVYRKKDTYHFDALQTGLVYLSPFIGGVLGTAVAGKLSDLIVRFMSRKNDGVYEPEFRLVMAIPIALCTTIGLMGFGWSAEERDNFIIPTVFFGIISFGCSLGSTTAITFCVDSYRQYAGEALVTLNFSKNVFHGLVFSLFFPHWLEADGSKKVFAAIGAIQMGCLLFSIPMYIYGKRARMWTVRKNLMESF